MKMILVIVALIRSRKNNSKDRTKLGWFIFLRKAKNPGFFRNDSHKDMQNAVIIPRMKRFKDKNNKAPKTQREEKNSTSPTSQKSESSRLKFRLIRTFDKMDMKASRNRYDMVQKKAMFKNPLDKISENLNSSTEHRFSRAVGSKIQDKKNLVG